MRFLIILFFLLLVDLLNIAVLPLIFLLLLGIFLKQKAWVFTLAFLSGVFLDILLLRPLGQTSLFFVVFIFVVLLYGRRFEAQSLPFIFTVTFLGEALYLFLFRYNYIFWQAIISAIVAVLIWKMIRKISA